MTTVDQPASQAPQKTFQPDAVRGTWTTPNDFVYACLGLALKLDVFLLSWHVFVHMGISVIVPYLITWALYVVPLIIIQTYMGQFSSSGFISAFRLSPVFKIMAYISLAVNMTVLSYYTAFAAIPLLYLINSFRARLPWSCEAFEKWGSHFPESKYNICNVISPADGEMFTAAASNTKFISYRVPSVLFFRSYFGNANIFIAAKSYYTFSWELYGCALLVWGIVAILVYTFCDAGKLGKLLRYLIATALALLLICLVRFLFLPGVAGHLGAYFNLNLKNMSIGFLSTPMYVMSAFGPGWGALVSLASFNQFKTNIARCSCIIGLGQMLIFLAFGFTIFMLDTYFAGLISHIKLDNYIVYTQAEFPLYLSSASAIASMAWPHLWSILFYAMLTLAALIVMIIQTNSILTSIFDEYAFLRARKTEVTFCLIAIVAVCSFYFCSSTGILNVTAMAMDTLFMQCTFNLLLIFVVLWFYGRESFQRDMLCMLERPFATWKVNVMRFVTPLCGCLILFWVGVIGYSENCIDSIISYITFICLVALPWLIIPAYIVYYMLKKSGSLKMRFQQCILSTEWHPVAENNQKKYEQISADKNAA